MGIRYRTDRRDSHVHVKLSGMITEARHREWTSQQLEPYVRHVWSLFGPDRCLFGSDMAGLPSLGQLEGGSGRLHAGARAVDNERSDRRYG